MHLVERASGPPSPGLGLNLPGNAVQALSRLGLGDAVISRGRRIRRREYRTRAGRLLFAVDEAGFWGPDAPSVCVRRVHLIDILGSDGVTAKTRWGTTVSVSRPMDSASA